MGNTRDTGYLQNLVTYDASGNIVLPANLTINGNLLVATQSYVTTQINNLINGAPALLDTLDELAAALGDDANFASTVTTSIAGKQAQLNGTGFVKVTGTTVSYDNSTYLTTSSAGSSYVPYTGATTNVNLGDFVLSAGGLNIDNVLPGTNGGALNLRQADGHSLWTGAPYTSIYAQPGNRLVFRFSNDNRSVTLDGSQVSTSTPRTFTFPDATGTFALTSDIPSVAGSYLPLTGGTLTGTLSVTNNGQILIGTTNAPTPVVGVSFPFSVTSPAATRIRIDSTRGEPNYANAGVGLYANGVQKWSFAHYSTNSGVDYDFTIYNDALTSSAILVKGSNSNVGIGTINPRTRLQVTPQSNAELPVLGQATGVAIFTSTNTNYGLQFNSTSDGTFHIQSQRFDNIATAYNLVLNYAGGNVGIGTNDPSAGKLVVNGNISISGNNYLDFGNGDSRIVNTGGILSFQTYTIGSFGTRMTITGPGNVGIGTSSINASSGYKMLRINGATTGGEIVLAGAEVEYGYMYANSGNFVIDALASQPMRFRTGAQNRMEISSAGKVEMGNALVSGEILKVIGPSGADNYISAYSGSIHMFLDADATNQAGIVGTQSSHNLILRTAGTNKVWITPGGNFGIGIALPNSKLEVVDGTGSVFRAINSGTNIMEIGNYKPTGSGGAGYQQLDIVSSIITFGTGTAGGGSATERMRITSTGVSYFTNNLTVGGSDSYTSATLASEGGLKVKRSIYGWYQAGSNAWDGSNYLHLKTNISSGLGGNIHYTMSLFTARLYSYTGTIREGQLGFHNWDGAFYAVASTGNIWSSPYRSSDGFVVLVLTIISSSHTGVTIDWHQAFPYPFVDKVVTSVSASSGTSAVY